MCDTRDCSIFLALRGQTCCNMILLCSSPLMLDLYHWNHLFLSLPSFLYAFSILIHLHHHLLCWRSPKMHKRLWKTWELIASCSLLNPRSSVCLYLRSPSSPQSHAIYCPFILICCNITVKHLTCDAHYAGSSDLFATQSASLLFNHFEHQISHNSLG